MRGHPAVGVRVRQPDRGRGDAGGERLRPGHAGLAGDPDAAGVDLDHVGAAGAGQLRRRVAAGVGHDRDPDDDVRVGGPQRLRGPAHGGQAGRQQLGLVVGRDHDVQHVRALPQRQRAAAHASASGQCSGAHSTTISTSRSS